MFVIQTKENELSFTLDERKATIKLETDDLFGEVINIDYPAENLVLSVGKNKVDYHMNDGATLGSVFEESEEMQAQFEKLKLLSKK